MNLFPCISLYLFLFLPLSNPHSLSNTINLSISISSTYCLSLHLSHKKFFMRCFLFFKTVLWTGKGNSWKPIGLGDVIEPKQVISNISNFNICQRVTSTWYVMKQLHGYETTWMIIKLMFMEIIMCMIILIWCCLQYQRHHERCLSSSRIIHYSIMLICKIAKHRIAEHNIELCSIR